MNMLVTILLLGLSGLLLAKKFESTVLAWFVYAASVIAILAH